jgi:hypothetical protein
VKCHDVTRAIDGLAGEITGDPTHFHLKGHGTGRAANIELSKDSEESQ